MVGQMVDQVALVTGGSSGIGRATALAFAAEGARVVIASRTRETGEQVVQEIREAGGEAMWVETDVTQAAQVEALVRETVEAYGRLDYAFNNAGSGGEGGWLVDIPEEGWDKTITGYLKSVWLCMKYEIPAMLAVGTGAIVNNSSVDGQRGFPWDPVYSAAKHGVIGLTKSAAMQYADKGVRINAVCPGWIRTPPVAQILEHNPDAEQGMLFHQPIGRLGRPEEVAQAVVWLCSDRASLVIGTAMPVDGGYLVV
ncbi:MAG: SDR family oxidoreductase [Chloroflexia bacterium]|nr:SDR family oxidoreductase [Chloroflexia bacterium]